MDGSQHHPMSREMSRDANGRFRPGCSGNPAGKKPGTRNRTTMLREALAEGEGAAVARVVIDKAIAGDAVAARFLLDRLEPKPRGRPIQLDLPEGESAAGDVVALFNSALHALAAGEITPAEAVEVSRFLEGRWRVLRAWQLEEKLTRWNDPLPVPGDRFVPEGVAERVVDPLRKEQAPVTPLARPSSSPPASTSNFPSPPAQRGERDAQGWRGEAEPYPKLGERLSGKMSNNTNTNSPARTMPPHPAPAKLDDVSLSLHNPLPRGERGNEDGVKPLDIVPLDLATIPDDVVVALRDRLLAIPGVREIALELGTLHSACNSGNETDSPPPFSQVSRGAIDGGLAASIGARR